MDAEYPMALPAAAPGMDVETTADKAALSAAVDVIEAAEQAIAFRAGALAERDRPSVEHVLVLAVVARYGVDSARKLLGL